MDAQKRDMCRVCLESINGCDEILLNNNCNMIKSILLITGVEVVSDPGQCEFLCSQCQCFLEQCIEFREKCISNDSVFHEMMTGSNHAEDDKSELQNPSAEYIKHEPVDLGDPADDVTEALVNDHLLPHEVRKPLVEKEVVSREDHNDDTKLRKPKQGPRTKCKQCGIVVAHSKLKEHQESHSSTPTKFACPYCPVEFLYIEDQQDHINANHSHEIQYICSQCGKAYATRSSFRVHYRAAHISDKRYTCTICGERFNRAWTKLRHLRVIHSTDRPFACEYCDKAFVYKFDLLRHIRCNCTVKKAQEGSQSSIEKIVKPDGKNHNVTKFSKAKKIGSGVQCLKCGKWIGPHNLSRHKELHNPSRKKLSCPHCPKKYLVVKSLRDHIHAVHTTGIRYACDECGKSFATRISFYGHLALVHNDNRRYACKDCGEKFADVQILSKHRRKEHLP